MTREELLRVLTFAGSLRNLSEERTALSSVDARWNIIAYAMRRHLEGKLLTVTALADAASVPYGTAMRRIGELIDEGLLMRRPRSKSGKSFSLHPTRELISQFQDFAEAFKRSVGEAFGFDDADAETGGTEGAFFFGGHYMASRILSYPNAMRVGIGQDRTVRILGSMDPTFVTLKNLSAQLGELCGTRFEITTLPLDQLHREICNNQERARSRYDIVAVDIPWIGQLAKSNAIMPLNDLIRDNRYRGSDFHSTIWQAARYRGQQCGLPIQPTVELLFCRKDVLSEAGLDVPRTTDELLEAARVLHHSRRGLSGIVMNYGRGTPVGHTFMQTLADFGAPIINLARTVDGFDTDTIGDTRPMIDTPAGREAAEFLIALLQYCHPESLLCDWDRRIGIFSRGEAAMTYGWSIRAAQFELDDSVDAHGNVAFAPHPAKPGLDQLAPVGGFILSLPASLDSDRASIGWKAMEFLTRPELMKLYVQSGNLTSPRFSTSADPEVQSISGMIRDIDQMEQKGILKVWPRPPIPEFADIVAILGHDIHFMLQRQTSIGDTLKSAQCRIDKVLRQSGCA